jgi:hypothetical protein
MLRGLDMQTLKDGETLVASAPAISWNPVQRGWQVGDNTLVGDPGKVLICSAQVPESVSMRQARLALYGVGLLASVNSAVAAMTGAAGDAARIAWEFSSEIRRSDPMVYALAQAVGLTEVEIDNLFLAAQAL